MNTFEHNHQKLSYIHHGQGDIVFVWVHGWGVDHQYLVNLSKDLSSLGQHYLVDLPGFGNSPKPEKDWFISDYAEFMHHFLNSQENKHIVWIGHSFGCRVGTKLAAHYPDLVKKMVFIAGSGLPIKRSLFQRMNIFLRIRLFKFMKLFVRGEENLNKLRSKFGSSDYRTAGDMRQIFMNTFSEHLSEDAKKISCPVTLLYGELDTETPPSMGEDYHSLIKDSSLEIFDGLDHYTILTKGQHQLAHRIKNFIKE